MKRFLLFFVFLSTLSNIAKSQQRSDFAVELAAFDQSVPLSYFKGISGVYEAYDINQIYRYHIAAPSREAADKILQEVKQSGFPNARVIDFGYIRNVCESQCGYTPPKPTGVGMRSNTLNTPQNNKPQTTTSGTIVNNTKNTNSNNNNLSIVSAQNNTNSNNTATVSAQNNTSNTTNNKRSISIDAASLLGNKAATLPEEYNDADWIAFLERNKYLGLSEEELLEVYRKHGNIRIEHAPWFEFKNKNADLGATDAELMELFIRHGNIKIEDAIWFSFKKEKGDADTDWLDFKLKNADLGATDAELNALYAKHGNIRISQAIWFHFKNTPQDYPKPTNTSHTTPNFNDNNSNGNSNNTDVQTVGFVMFEFGGIKLSENTVPELDKVASALVKNKNLRIELTGHADAVGSTSNNQALSLKRAGTVRQYLANKGVNMERIKINAMGEADPIAINNNKDGSDCPEGRKYNRRVDLRVADPDGNEVRIVSNIIVPNHLQIK